ncbi:MAG: endolytic transglycosylase MltG [bacterium]|nr:endolytic transglycosylase MltG [bacterium]
MKKILFFTLLLVALIFLVRDLVLPAWIVVSPPDANVISVEILEGSTLATTAVLLEEQNLIKSAFWYRVYGRINKNATKIKAGEYGLKEGSRFSSLARILARGPVREELTITIPEGWTIFDIQNRLEELGVDITPSDFYAERFADEFPFLKDLPKKATLEGFLFPDTYRVWADDLPDGLFRKQLSEFSLRTIELRADIQKDGRDLYEVLTLASIVEKEAKHDEDRPKIASVFQNRLDVGMRLQSDATLNYVTKSGKSRLDASDLENTSVYNTYQHAGLPPTPIANPGLASFESAVHPAKTSYFFFLTDSDGKAYFGRNLEEHSANRYRVFGQ